MKNSVISSLDSCIDKCSESGDVSEKFKRILIKISGEMFSDSSGSKFDFNSVSEVSQNIKNVINLGIGVSLVIGGGNVIRGRDFSQSNIIKQETADSIGMLSTVINGILIKDYLETIGVKSEIISCLNLPFGIIKNEHFNITKLINEHKVIIFVGGIGVPYFSTDTACVVGAYMSKCNAILKATKTDGVYDKDPNKYSDSSYIPELTYDYAIRENLNIMDKTAFALASQKKIPIYIFSAKEENCFVRVIKKEIKHSIVK